jgi:dTDP-4-dehydrorhamnose reductase
MKKRFLVLGSTGQLGKAFQEVLRKEEKQHYFLSHQEVDITDTDKLKSCLERIKPAVLINCSAYNEVDLAETNPAQAFLVNAKAVENLAEISKKNNIFLIHYSTDYVFDGATQRPYAEEDLPCPLNKYGQSKLDGEKAIQGILNDYLLFRVSWVFGRGERNFLAKAIKWASTQKEMKIAQDEISVPTFTEDIVQATVSAQKKGLVGLYHLTNTGYCSRCDWVRFFFEKKGFDNKIIPVSSDHFHLPAKRPKFSAMTNHKLSTLLKNNIPSWQEAVERFIQTDSTKKE